MISTEEIIARKIADRCCRRQIKESTGINSMIQECCQELQIDLPKIIYCETLTRNFSAFYLRDQAYLIYDSCLMESLYIYDCIIMSKKDSHDMEKLFYKLIGEELILKDDLPRSLYFSGKYRKLDYLFEKEHVDNEYQIQQMISAQSYFLIGHELGHLSLDAPESKGIPNDYWKFAKACIRVLTDRVLDSYPIDVFFKMRYGYFMDICPSTLNEYFESLWKSNRFKHFVEECYCDFQGLRLLLEHYQQPVNSIKAISAALNYLILQEAIRSDMAENKFFFGDNTHDVSKSTYFSVLRMEILLFTLQINKIDNIEEGFREIQNRSMLTHYWSDLINKIPSEEAFSTISEADLPDIDRKELINMLLSVFYYAHVR